VDRRSPSLCAGRAGRAERADLVTAAVRDERASGPAPVRCSLGTKRESGERPLAQASVRECPWCRGRRLCMDRASAPHGLCLLRAGLRSKAEVGESVLAIQVLDEPLNLAAAEVKQARPLVPICPSSSPLVLRRALKWNSTSTRSPSSSRAPLQPNAQPVTKDLNHPRQPRRALLVEVRRLRARPAGGSPVISPVLLGGARATPDADGRAAWKRCCTDCMDALICDLNLARSATSVTVGRPGPVGAAVSSALVPSCRGAQSRSGAPTQWGPHRRPSTG
jgi:hypothetical protein